MIVLVENQLLFVPVAYTREELVEEAELLVDENVAAWLTAQPESTLEAIMTSMGERIWAGGVYLDALKA